LTEEEKQDPLSVIREFFEDVKLIEARVHFYNLLEVALTRSNVVYDDASNRNAVLYFIKQLEKMMEASYELSTSPKLIS
jgi:hypothetical protein